MRDVPKLPCTHCTGDVARHGTPITLTERRWIATRYTEGHAMDEEQRVTVQVYVCTWECARDYVKDRLDVA